MKLFNKDFYRFYDSLSNKDLDYIVNYLELKIKKFENSHNLSFIKYLDEITHEYETAKAVKDKRTEKIQSYKNKRPRRFI